MAAPLDHPTIQQLEKLYEAFNAADPDRVASLFSEDADSYSPAGPLNCGDHFKGRDHIRRGVAGRMKILNNVKWIDREYRLVDDNTVYVRWRMVGTGPNGEAINTLGCEFWQFRNGEATLKDTYYKRVV